MDRLIDGLIALLQSFRSKPSSWTQISARLRRFAMGLTIVYGICLFLTLLLIDRIGESHWFTSFLLYLPVQGWLLPLAMLSPVCLLVRPKLLWIHAGLAVWTMAIYQPFHWNISRKTDNPTLTVVTANIGNRKGQSIQPFIDKMAPDLFVAQEALGRAGGYAKEFPGFHVAAASEHVLVSKFPILSATALTITSRSGAPAAARFEVDWNGTRIHVYSVHMPTPRGQLENMKGLGFLSAIVGREGGYGRRLRGLSSTFWSDQIQLADDLANDIERQSGPVIVVGDFNAPDRGLVHRRFNKSLTDVFAERGRGWGLTFPGYTRNPLSLFGPWLRLDYIRVNGSFEPLDAQVESGPRPQHFAMSGKIALKKK